MKTTLKLSDIKTNGGTQSRVQLSQETIDEYAEAYTDGAKFPPVVVFHDGSDYWLADGFHRVKALKQAELDMVDADVRQGTQRDAILYSVGTNTTHGLRRTNADKRAAVLLLLNDAEWGQWSDSAIARQCAVSHTFVNNLRSSLATVASEDGNAPTERTYTTKHGTTATMNTGNIGKSQTTQPPTPTPADDTEEYTEELAGEEDGYDWTDEEQEVKERPETDSQLAKLYKKCGELFERWRMARSQDEASDLREELYDTMSEYEMACFEE